MTDLDDAVAPCCAEAMDDCEAHGYQEFDCEVCGTTWQWWEEDLDGEWVRIKPRGQLSVFLTKLVELQDWAKSEKLDVTQFRLGDVISSVEKAIGGGTDEG